MAETHTDLGNQLGDLWAETCLPPEDLVVTIGGRTKCGLRVALSSCGIKSGGSRDLERVGSGSILPRTL